jgi:photosystem II stability/assembly factor-like uncharacterized protein
VLTLDPRASKTLYAGDGINGGVFKSTDGGATWRTAGLKGQGVNALAIVSDGRVVYAGTGRPVFKSTDAGASWVKVGRVGTSIDDLTLDPRNPHTIYAINTILHPAVFKSLDGGTSWRRLVGTEFVQTLVPDPRNPRLLYAGTVSGLMMSSNGGASWRTDGLNDVEALALDPQNPRTVYAGTMDGLYTSTDSGKTWRRLDLAQQYVHALAIDPSGHLLYAGTDDGRVFAFEFGR